MNTLNEIDKRLSDTVLVFLGTVPGECATDYLRLAAARSLQQNDGPCIIHYDYAAAERGSDIEFVDQHLLNISLAVSNTIVARFPDRGLIEELEARGQLGHIPPGLLQSPGSAAENLGTGSIPRVGAFLFEVSQEQFRRRLRLALRNTRAYARQWSQIKEDGAKESPGEKVDIYVVFASAGGTGTGALPGCQAVIREVAEDLGLDVRVDILALILGTIEPSNPPIARRNQDRIFSHLLAEATGHHAHLFFGTTPPRYSSRPFDSLTIMSNSNAHGEIGTLAGLCQMLAQVLFLLVRSPAGERFREQRVDLEGDGWAVDRFGAPRCASTISLSVLSADRKKALAFCSNRLAANLCRTLVQLRPDQQMKEAAARLVRQLELVETSDETVAATRLAHVSDFGGESCVHAVVIHFRNRTGSERGWKKFLAAERAFQRVMETYIPATIASAIEAQAEAWLAEISQRLANEEERSLHSQPGLGEQVGVLRYALSLVGEFETANRDKIEALSEALRPRLTRIEEMVQWGDRMKRAFRLVRWLQPLTTRQMARNLVLDAEDAIRCQAEIVLRQTLASRLFPAVQDALSARLSVATSTAEQVRGIEGGCSREAERLLGLSGAATAPVGIELVDAEFLNSFYAQAAGYAGGAEKLESAAFQSFLSKVGSLLAFLEHPLEEMHASLLETCELPFVEPLRCFDVEKALRRAAPNPQRLRQFMHQAIQESAGRVRAPGAIGAESQRLKMLVVPEPPRFEWLQQLANEVDCEPGEWALVSNGGDWDSIGLFQCVSGLSLACLVQPSAREFEIQDTQALATQGSDPVSALLPSPMPSWLDVDMALVKAAFVGALEIKDKDGTFLRFKGDRRFLGSGWAEVRQRLRRSYADLVAIHASFAESIFLQPDRLVLGADGLDSIPVDPIAVRLVTAQAEELDRYAQRTRRTAVRSGGGYGDGTAS